MVTRIARITPAGVLTQFNPVSPPISFTTGPDGNVWYTAQAANLVNGNFVFVIGRITPAGVVTEFSAGITPSVNLNYITTGPDGALWFTECGSGLLSGPGSIARIGRITTSGVITEFATGISAASCPSGITAGPDGNLWFTETSSKRIGRITPAGVVTEFSASTNPAMQPSVITAGPDGNLLVHCKHIRLSSDSRFRIHDRADYAGRGGYRVQQRYYDWASLQNITAGPDGNLWFTELAGRIGRITTTGVVTEFSAGITAGSGPYGITAGPDGNIWFTEVNGVNIGRVSGLPLGTTTTVTSSLTPSTLGANVTFTATITRGSTPTGTVQFKDGAGNLGSPVAVTAGQAQFATTALGIGAHTITAVYSGDTNNAGSTSAAFAQTVNQATTTTILNSSLALSALGASVTFTATITGGLGPTGTVQFKDGVSNLGSPVAVTSSQAQFATTVLGIGAHTITAVYSGDTNNAGSTSAGFAQGVTQATTTTTVTSSLVLSTVGANVTFTATITGGSNPTGTVQFKDGAANLGSPVAVTAGQAQFATTALGVGAHTITAVYSGDTNNAGSTSAAFAQTVIVLVQRAFVSATGNNANTATLCAVTAPCKTFAGAAPVVADNGEIVALNTAPYGSVTLTRSISLTAAPGVYAGISVFAGSGVTIASPNISVVLRGLTINGQGGANGILVDTPATGEALDRKLRHRQLRERGSGAGVLVNAPATVRVVDALVRDGFEGISIANGATAIITDSKILNNAFGILVTDASAAVKNSTVSASSIAGIASGASGTARISVTSSAITNNGTGVMISQPNSVLSLTNSTVTGNAVGLSQSAGATLELLGNNTVRQNGTQSSGTITTAPRM